jgi:twitching motility protein PilT
MNLKTIVTKAVDLAASDIHIQAGSKVMVRIHGQLHALELPPIASDVLEPFLREVAGDERWAALERDRTVDCAYAPDAHTRLRVSIYFQRRLLAASLRVLPVSVPAFEGLNLPAGVLQLADEERGLVLVTGTTSSGKSTTIAALFDHINATQRCKIITIEDPIEYVHDDKKSLISQREVGVDTPGFAEALRRALRQDPNVIFIGELRDYETMATTVRAADTGHLVFSTLHSTNVTQTLQRVIAMFPSEERALLRMQLAANLEGVVSLSFSESWQLPPLGCQLFGY